MLKLIHGDNYYISHKKLSELKKLSKEVEYNVIDGDTINDTAEIFISEQSYGMFKTSTVTIVKRFFKNPKKISLEKKIIEKLSKSDLSSIELVFWEDSNIYGKKKKSKAKTTTSKKPRATSKLDTYLKNNAKIEEYINLSEVQLKEWIKSELSKYGISASSEAINSIIQRVGVDQSILDEELNKLSLFLNSESRKELKKEDVKFITTYYQKEFQIWDLTDAFFNKDQKKAMEILDAILINPARDFPMIIGAVLKQIKTIYLVGKFKNDSMTGMSKLRLPPFMYYKAESLSRKISKEMLKLMYRKFIDLDYSIKQGKIDVKLGLDLLIMTLSR